MKEQRKTTRSIQLTNHYTLLGVCRTTSASIESVARRCSGKDVSCGSSVTIEKKLANQHNKEELLTNKFLESLCPIYTRSPTIINGTTLQLSMIIHGINPQSTQPINFSQIPLKGEKKGEGEKKKNNQHSLNNITLPQMRIRLESKFPILIHSISLFFPPACEGRRGTKKRHTSLT